MATDSQALLASALEGVLQDYPRLLRDAVLAEHHAELARKEAADAVTIREAELLLEASGGTVQERNALAAVRGAIDQEMGQLKAAHRQAVLDHAEAYAGRLAMEATIALLGPLVQRGVLP